MRGSGGAEEQWAGERRRTRGGRNQAEIIIDVEPAVGDGVLGEWRSKELDRRGHERFKGRSV